MLLLFVLQNFIISIKNFSKKYNDLNEENILILEKIKKGLLNIQIKEKKA